MNGLITESSPRIFPRSSLTSRQMITSVALGVCLFSGFIAGVNISPQVVQKLVRMNPLHPETLDYSKISWIQPVEVKTTQGQYDAMASVDLEFKPYVLDTSHAQKSFAPKKMSAKKRAKMFRELQLAYTRFQNAVKFKPRSENIFYEYEHAAKRLRQDFIAATDATAKPSVMMAAVSAQPEAREESAPVSEVPSRKQSLSLVRSSAESMTSLKRWKPAPRRKAPNEVQGLVVAATQPEEKKSEKNIPAAVEKPVVQVSEETQSAAVVTEVSYPEASNAVVAPAVLDTQSVNIQPQVAENTITEVKQTSSSADLTKEEKDKLANGLLAIQIENKNIASLQAVAPIIARAKANQEARQTMSDQAVGDRTDPEKEKQFLDDANEVHAFAMKHSTSSCATLKGHEFIKPNPELENGVDTQICPEHKTWISKSWSEKGWVKVEGSEHIATLTMQPAANGGSTLLLDQNALALVAIKSGVRVAKGAGVIIGLVPTGYKVEFAGRGEETEYFELNKQKYFAVINAEPGAGVIELISEQNQNFSSTVFTPVLEDTITYLDLVAPQARNIGVQVVKNGGENDAEVVGLSVGISTQGRLQAITQSNGRTILQNVNLVPGYPVFIDVSSKSKESDASYTYRYELKRKSRQGYYVVNQISERSLYKWLKQVKQGLNDQSAMVVGFYNRKILNGFTNHYTTKVEPKSAHFGLEPLNYSILWDGKISSTEPLEGDVPRFMSVQVPEGLSQVQLLNEANQIANAQLIPVSPRVIHVISE